MTERNSDKTQLRQLLLAKRLAIAAEVRQHWDQAIGEQVLAWCASRPVRILGIYWPIRKEPDLRPIYATLHAGGIRLALPVVVEQQAALQFAAWVPGEPLIKDAMGVSVPAQQTPMLQPDALLVPCVGFNTDNVRLGYGGGFYDRTLANSPRPVTLGIAYACNRADFAAAPHDVALDVIITEQSGATD